MRVWRQLTDFVARHGAAALVTVHDRGITPESALVRRSSLEDVFLRLTGRSLID